MKDDLKNIVLLAAFFLAATCRVWWNPSYIRILVDNQELISAIITAALGSFAGAYGAQHIIEKLSKRKDIVSKLRACNAATMAAAHIYNTVSNSKKQQITPLADNYKQVVNQFRIGSVTTSPDLQSFSILKVNLTNLSALLYEKLDARPRALMAFDQLVMFLQLLNDSIEHRNNILHDWKIKGSSDSAKEQMLAALLGIVSNEGGDFTYPNLIEHIEYYSH